MSPPLVDPDVYSGAPPPTSHAGEAKLLLRCPGTRRSATQSARTVSRSLTPSATSVWIQCHSGWARTPYPRAGDSETDHCVLTLAASTALPLDGGLATGPARPLEPDELAAGPLRGLVRDHAFGGCLRAVGDALVRHRLTGPGGGIELWADPDIRWVQVLTPDDHPGRGRVVAIEPMTCPPDALNSGTDLIWLKSGATWSGSWGLRPLPG